MSKSAKPKWGKFVEQKLPAFMARSGLIRALLNNYYLVQEFHHETEWGAVVQLMVCRTDRAAIRPTFYDMMRIKSELFGAERTAIEVCPPESELVDVANMYWLWVLPEGFKLPFGDTKELEA
jgi:hypothetical protein